MSSAKPATKTARDGAKGEQDSTDREQAADGHDCPSTEDTGPPPEQHRAQGADLVDMMDKGSLQPGSG